MSMSESTTQMFSWQKTEWSPVSLHLFIEKENSWRKGGKGKMNTFDSNLCTVPYVHVLPCTFFRARALVIISLSFDLFQSVCCTLLCQAFNFLFHCWTFDNFHQHQQNKLLHKVTFHFFFFFKCVGVLFLSSPLTYSPTHLSPLLTWAGLHCSTLWRGASLSLKDFCSPTSVDEKTNGSRRNHTCGGL